MSSPGPGGLISSYTGDINAAHLSLSNVNNHHPRIVDLAVGLWLGLSLVLLQVGVTRRSPGLVLAALTGLLTSLLAYRAWFIRLLWVSDKQTAGQVGQQKLMNLEMNISFSF